MKELQSSLVISCQAPSNSPLHNPDIIANIALACVNQGAKGLRIDSPNHIKAVRKLLPDIPIIGLWKQMGLDSDVYITPRLEDAIAVAEAGADIIAIDATQRKRPNGETLEEIISHIQQNLHKLVMADIDTKENAIIARDLGVDFIGTTLYGYTQDTRQFTPPNFDLIEELVREINTPIICEGELKPQKKLKKLLIRAVFVSLLVPQLQVLIY